jgi:hypothetical protein
VRPRRDGDSDLRPVPIVEALERHEVRYVAIGSYAAIAQGVDLDVTDFDIVPAADEENAARLVEALKELRAEEKIGEGTEPLYELHRDPASLTDVVFREFTTEFGKLDVVFRPAGFPRGYDDLVDRAVIVRLEEEESGSGGVDVIMAEAEAVYESKRAAARPKDVEVLRKFEGIHPTAIKEAMRAKYRASQRPSPREAPSLPATPGPG